MENKKDNEILDLVYILGTGSKWQDNEIRYSLRSAEMYFPHARVFVVGEKPKWLTNVIHIPAEDPFDHKLKNGIHKITVAAKSEEIGERFVLMNDDFFFLKKIEKLKMYHRGRLKETRKKHPTKSGYYFDAIIDTQEMLKKLGIDDPKDYSVHYPIIYEKSKVIELVEKLDRVRNGYLFRTVYSNYFSLGGYQRNDVKVKGWEEMGRRKFQGIDVLSTNDRMVLSKSFQAWINKRFPEPSKYEAWWPKQKNDERKVEQYHVTQRFSFNGKTYNEGEIIEDYVPDEIIEANNLKRIVAKGKGK